MASFVRCFFIQFLNTCSIPCFKDCYRGMQGGMKVAVRYADVRSVVKLDVCTMLCLILMSDFILHVLNCMELLQFTISPLLHYDVWTYATIESLHIQQELVVV